MLREGGATAPPVEPIATLMAAASAERGQVVARNCTSCHAVDPADQRLTAGPILWGVFGRAPASLPGFEYSSALQRLGGVWNEEALNAFVAHLMATAPGTSMQFEGLARSAMPLRRGFGSRTQLPHWQPDLPSCRERRNRSAHLIAIASRRLQAAGL